MSSYYTYDDQIIEICISPRSGGILLGTDI